MSGSKFFCPLCNQPVSSSLYQQITGIWKAKERELAKVKFERRELKKKQQIFELKKDSLIKAAVEKNSRLYKAQLKALEKRSKRIESQANKRITRAIQEAHVKEQNKAKAHIDRFEKRLENSMKKQIKISQKRALSEAKTKYIRVERSLKSTLSQFKGENSKLSKKNEQLNERVERLEKQLEEKATPQIEGLLYEKELMKELQELFPDDKFINTGKGGDIIQCIVNDGEVVGTVIYECKRVKNYAFKHVKQAYDAQHKRKADYGVLVTNAMKKGTNGLFVERGVIVVHATAVLYVARMLRKQIIQISEMKLGQAERNKVVKGILKYMEGPEFTNSVGSIVQDSLILYKRLIDEAKVHVKEWKERYLLYSRINAEANAIQGNTKALLCGKEKEEKKVSKLPALTQLPRLEEK